MMLLRIFVYGLLCIAVVGQEHRTCLTGYMTDVQSWVDETGVLTTSIDHRSAIDLSANANPVPILQQKMTIMRFTGDTYVKYLSMARCRLNRIPTVFQFRDSQGRDLAITVEYITFYGNSFQDISSPEDEYDVAMNATRAREMIIGVGYQRRANAIWSTGFKEIQFPRLKELDLRACSIQIISGYIFAGMPKLEALYIGENAVAYIDANAFVGLHSLKHLDFSRNKAYDDIGNFKTLNTETLSVFKSLKNLTSLDFSFTKISNRHMTMFKNLGSQLTRLSLCDTGLVNLEDDFFNQTSLRILDVSGNNGILARDNVLRGLEKTLQILYAKDIGLRKPEVLTGFKELQILSLSTNEIALMASEVARTLQKLQILDLDQNRISTWFSPIYSKMPNLRVLTLKNNNINVISEEMMQDIAKIDYIALSGNFMVCNCHFRDFFELALRNEEKYSIKADKNKNRLLKTDNISATMFHTGFVDYNKLINERVKASVNCTDKEFCYEDLSEDVDADFLLLDYNQASYSCLKVPEIRLLEFREIYGCNREFRDIDYDQMMSGGRNMLYILLTLPILLMLLAFVFVFRKNLRYFFITMRNSALLSMINKNEVLDDNTIFHYDVFVSYCNEDRSWVLDHLLPHLERDCCVSACLHERDFQVGHSILENIVSCMDRSRSIMLIISQKFLLSQWCQFEMHLAQHRLLETRREDLTLVLLEDIPRRLRPNTLHYLMLSKTYIVWPKTANDRPLFWKRLKKTLVTMKMKNSPLEGVSLA